MTRKFSTIVFSRHDLMHDYRDSLQGRTGCCNSVCHRYSRRHHPVKYCFKGGCTLSLMLYMSTIVYLHDRIQLLYGK